ncbi:hypothetical protein Dimus_010727, partial [Dionaea muscipula]
GTSSWKKNGPSANQRPRKLRIPGVLRRLGIKLKPSSAASGAGNSSSNKGFRHSSTGRF